MGDCSGRRNRPIRRRRSLTLNVALNMPLNWSQPDRSTRGDAEHMRRPRAYGVACPSGLRPEGGARFFV